jgi:hypothetical protein
MIVAANTYKKKISGAKSEQNMGPSYNQMNMAMQQSQRMPPNIQQQQQQQNLHSMPPQSLMQSHMNFQQNTSQQQQQLSPMSQHLQNDVGEDVMRSLDKLLASSSIGEKSKYLNIPDRIPLPPQYESSMANQPLPPISKLHNEYMNGHSTNNV